MRKKSSIIAACLFLAIISALFGLTAVSFERGNTLSGGTNVSITNTQVTILTNAYGEWVDGVVVTIYNGTSVPVDALELSFVVTDKFGDVSSRFSNKYDSFYSTSTSNRQKTRLMASCDLFDIAPYSYADIGLSIANAVNPNDFFIKDPSISKIVFK